MNHIYLFLKNYLFLLIIGLVPVQPAFAQNCGITGDIDVCENEVVSYSSGTSGEIYQWNAYNGIVSGTGPSVDVNWNMPGNGELTLVVKDSLNQVVCTQSVDITIHPQSVPVIQPSFENACGDIQEGDDGADGENRNPCFSVCDSTWITYSTPYHNGSTYSWSVTGNAVVDSTTPHQIDVFWTGAGTGLVEVTETDANGCVGSDEICVEILPKPMAGINSEPAASGGVVNACLDQPIQFYSNSSAGAGSPIWSYTWVFGDGSTEVLSASESNGNTTYAYSGPGTYNAMLIVENECHCKDTAYVTVNVSSDPGLEIECISTVCPGSSVTYSTDSTCTDYLWSATNGTIQGDSTNSEVTVTWGNTSPAYLTVSTPGCNGICSTPTTVEIPVISPSANIHGDELVCQYACETYTLDCNIPVDSIIWHFPAGVTVQSDTINEHEVKVCFYDPDFTGGQIEVEYYHNTPGSQNELSCGGTALLDIEVRPRLYLSYPEEICDSSMLTVNYNNATSGDLEWTITDAAGSTTHLTHVQSATDPFETIWSYGPGTFEITVHDLSDNYCDAPDSFILKVN
ncbi:PKD domain-containing protein, partial [Salinivirga cyanobacteriivorans]